MKSFFSANSRKKGRFVLVVYVDGESTVFALFGSDGEKVRVERFGIQYFGSSTLEQTLDDIFGQIVEHFAVHEMVVSFSNDHFKAQILRKSLERPTPKHLTQKTEARQLEQKLKTQAEKEFRMEIFADSGILPDSFQAQTFQVLSRKVDGYDVESFADLKGKEVEVDILGTFLLDRSLQTLDKRIVRHGLPKPRIVHPIEAIRDFAEAKRRDGVFVYIEEQRSQIAVRRGKKFTASKSIRFGREQLQRIFGEELGMTENIAREFEADYVRGKLSPEVRERVHSLLLPEVRKFDTLVKSSLEELQVPLPGNIYIFGSRMRDFLNPFEEDIEAELPFVQSPEASFLFPQDVGSVDSFSELTNSRYTILFLLAYPSLFTKT